MRSRIALAVLYSVAAVGAALAAEDVRPLLERGRFSPEQTRAVMALLDRAERRGLPASALSNRIREGIARHVDPKVILGVVDSRLGDLEHADEIVRRCGQSGVPVPDRERALLRLAESFTQGLKVDDVAPLVAAAQKARGDVETVGRAAEVMSRLDHKGFPPRDTRDVVAAAVASGWSADRLDGLIGLMLEADALHLPPGDVRDVLLEGIRQQKQTPDLVDKMRRAAEDAGDERRERLDRGRGRDGGQHPGEREDHGDRDQ